MVAERPQLFTLLIVPNLDHVVGASAGEQLAVCLPADVHDVMGVAFKGLDELAGLDVKDLDELVGAAARELATVRAEGNAEYLIAVAALDVLQQSAARGIEDLELAILRRRATARREILTIR